MQISYVAFYKANSDIPFIAATGKDAVKALAGHATHAKPVSQMSRSRLRPTNNESRTLEVEDQ